MATLAARSRDAEHRAPSAALLGGSGTPAPTQQVGATPYMAERGRLRQRAATGYRPPETLLQQPTGDRVHSASSSPLLGSSERLTTGQQRAAHHWAAVSSSPPLGSSEQLVVLW